MTAISDRELIEKLTQALEGCRQRPPTTRLRVVRVDRTVIEPAEDAKADAPPAPSPAPVLTAQLVADMIAAGVNETGASGDEVEWARMKALSVARKAGVGR